MSSAPVMLIRKEEYEDWPVVHALNASVFETAAEAKLVDALRRDAKPIISLVAAEGKEIVGPHLVLACFSGRSSGANDHGTCAHGRRGA
jgi:predicted N-acetyltransferase YhbS